MKISPLPNTTKSETFFLAPLTSVLPKLFSVKPDLRAITLLTKLKSKTADSILSAVCDELKKEGYILYVASNAIYNTIKLMLLRKGLIEYIDMEEQPHQVVRVLLILIEVVP